MEERLRKQGQSQEEYCKGCILRNVCNVILKDDESCEDMAQRDESFKFEYFVGGQFTKGR